MKEQIKRTQNSRVRDVTRPQALWRGMGAENLGPRVLELWLMRVQSAGHWQLRPLATVGAGAAANTLHGNGAAGGGTKERAAGAAAAATDRAATADTAAAHAGLQLLPPLGGNKLRRPRCDEQAAHR